MNKFQFQGKVALISGAGSGIGFELAKQLGKEGATIIGTDINTDRVRKMVISLKSAGIKAFGYTVDHADVSAVEELARKIQVDIGSVDILCCNAGVGHGTKIDAIPLKDWKWVIDINLWGVIYMIHFFLPSMIEKKQGQILITASGAGLFPLAGMAPYCMTKSALVTLTNVMRMELKIHNINVSALCPGIINTNIIADGIIQGDKNKTYAQKFYASWGTHPSKVAKAAIKGMKKNKGIIPTPRYHVMMNYLMYRLSPALIVGLGRFLYKRGWNFIGPLLKE
jgi:short-subunit dehydrogenase